jgi:hypothetical protein
MRKAARALSRLVVAVALCAGGRAWAEAQEAMPDKSEFNLFHPTPLEYMREMDTDFPGATESPYTVDAGHFQLETLAYWARDRDSFHGVDYRWDAWSIGPITLRVGLLDRLDAQLVLEPYQLVSEHELGTSSPSKNEPGPSASGEEIRTTRRGFGDTTVRLKYNVWGNDEGSTALAVAPYVRFPTSQDHLGSSGVEGGLAVPVALSLPRDVYLGVTSRIEAVRDEASHDYHPEFGNSVELGHDLVADLFGYVEFSAFVSTEPGAEWIGTVEAGWSCPLTENVQVNAGVSVGVTRGADDVSPFIGIAWRH